MEHAMRDRPRSDRHCTPALAPATARARGLWSSGRVVAAGAALARGARLRVWAPIALRALALGIALLGLLGIGSVVARAPASAAPEPPAPGLSFAELGFSAVSAR